MKRVFFILIILLFGQMPNAFAQCILCSNNADNSKPLPQGEFYTSDKNTLPEGLLRHFLFDAYQSGNGFISSEEDNGFYTLVIKLKQRDLKFDLVQTSNSLITIKSCFDCDQNHLAVLDTFAEFLNEKNYVPQNCYACDPSDVIIDPEKLFNLKSEQAKKPEFQNALTKIKQFFLKRRKQLDVDGEFYAADSLLAIARYEKIAEKRKLQLTAYDIIKNSCETHGCSDDYIQTVLHSLAHEINRPNPFKDRSLLLELTMPQLAMKQDVIMIYGDKNLLTDVEKQEIKTIFEYLYGDTTLVDPNEIQQLLKAHSLLLKNKTWQEISNFKNYGGANSDMQADKIRARMAKDLGAIITRG